MSGFWLWGLALGGIFGAIASGQPDLTSKVVWVERTPTLVRWKGDAGKPAPPGREFVTIAVQVDTGEFKGTLDLTGAMVTDRRGVIWPCPPDDIRSRDVLGLREFFQERFVCTVPSGTGIARFRWHGAVHAIDEARMPRPPQAPAEAEGPQVEDPIDPADVNRDGVVDRRDRALFRALLGTCTDSPRYNSMQDFVHDGCIDEKDQDVFDQFYAAARRKR